jgi:TonB-dependent receptor
MKSIIIIFLFYFSSFSIIFSQGTVRGKISDNNGESLIGARVILKDKPSVGTVTDFDGNYTIKIADSLPHTLVFSYISFLSKEETLNPLSKGEIFIKNIELSSNSTAIQEVVIEGKAVKAKESYMERRKINASTTIDFISSETMKKTGDANATAAVARVSGVSTSGAFITVRGIGDRYVKTMINGSRIPTLDPFTNNIKLDIFPSSLIDNILISKTASPDVPGDWAGAYISIETKDYPEKLAVNIETTIGYNAQTTFKDVVSSERSKTDWLGYDNGLRNYDHDKFTRVNTSPSNYEVLVANGLQNFYNQLGVNKTTPFTETYFKLGLIELGLLEKGLVNDASAVSAAKTKFESGNYRDVAFRSINGNAEKAGQAFSNKWNTTKRRAPLNYTQSFSIGNQVKLFGKELGFIFGFRYANATQYDGKSIANRVRIDPASTQQEINLINSTLQKVSKETRALSALMNVAYKLNSNNSLSLLFMPNFNGENNVQDALDTASRASGNGSDFLIKRQFYEQRRQLVYQFKSEHFLPVPKIKIETNVSYTQGKSVAPDIKNPRFEYVIGTNTYQVGGINAIQRYFRYLSENVLDAKFFAEMPISAKPDLIRKVKLGAGYLNNSRDYNQYNYILQTPVNPAIITLPSNAPDIDVFFAPSKYTIQRGNANGINNVTYIDHVFANDGLPAADFSIGANSITSGFAMLDYTIIKPLRVAGGLRVEQARFYTDAKLYDSLKTPDEDKRRIVPRVSTDYLDFLPSINLIYKLKNDELAPINLRFNYSKTVARPSLREISPVRIFDYELQSEVIGNPLLKPVKIDNFDFRIESYFKSGDNISFSLFHKNFKNHIEIRYDESAPPVFSWNNAENSFVSGIELEGRKRIYKSLEFRANVTFARSQTKLIYYSPFDPSIAIDTVTRGMLGQAPYVLNGILSYAFDSLGLNCALSYNVQGPRLVLISSSGVAPNVYELPRHLLDFKVSKTLGKHFAVSFTVKDVLNAKVIRRYDDKFKTPEGKVIDFDTFRYGTNYQFSLSYRL